MRLLPEGYDEMDPNIRWAVPRYLDFIEEMACDPESSGTDALGTDETWERVHRAWELRDRRAEDEAAADLIRADVRKWWQGFSQRQLLSDLFARNARRRKSGSLDSSRRPSHQEGLRLAREMLADIPKPSRLDTEWEHTALSEMMTFQWLLPIGVQPSREVLRACLKRSRSNRVHFDALSRYCEELDNQGKAIPPLLARWRQGVAGGRRRRPAMKHIPPHRPAQLDQPMRNIQVQFTLGLLRRVGVPPRGDTVSGCRIVAEAVGLSEYTVERIWKACPWGGSSFIPVMQRTSKAIAERTGIHSR